jgi:ribose transport system permease protein
MENKAKSRIHIIQDSLSIIIFFAAIVVVLGIFGILSPYFFTPGNIIIAFTQLSTVAICALGLTFVIAVGHSDMSFQFICCLGAMTMSFFIKLGWSPIPCIILGLITGMIFGVFNGLAVGRFNLPDMIATIAIGSIAWGAAYFYSNGEFIYQNFLTSGILNFQHGNLFGIRNPVYYLFIIYILGYIFLNRTKFGRNFYAIGSNQTAARFSGVKVEKYIIIAYVLCAGLATFANQLLTSEQGQGNVRGGLLLLMPAYAAVFVGVSIFKKPTIIGTFMGAFLISFMQNGFTLLNTPFYIMDAIVGLVLVAALILSRLQVKQKVQEDSMPVTNQAQR